MASITRHRSESSLWPAEGRGESVAPRSMDGEKLSAPVKKASPSRQDKEPDALPLNRQEKMMMSRRGAMRYALGGVLAVPATMVTASAAVQGGGRAYEKLKPKPTYVYPPPAFILDPKLAAPGEVTLEREGNTTVVHYPDGGRHYILYNTHAPIGASGQERSGLEKPPDQLPEDLDGIVIETAQLRWADKDPTVSPFAFDLQYTDAMQYASEKGIPVILAQPFLCGSQEGEKRRLFETGTFAGAVAGLILHIKNKLRDVAKGRDDFSRRSFLRNSAVPIGVAALLSQPVVASLLRIASAKVGRADVTAGANEFLCNGQPWIHHLFPNQAVTEAVLIEKIEWLMKNYDMKRLATIVGTDHTALETFSLMSHGERIAFLEQPVNRQILRDAASPATVSGIRFYRCRRTSVKAVEGDRVNILPAWNLSKTLHVPHLSYGMYNLTGIRADACEAKNL